MRSPAVLALFGWCLMPCGCLRIQQADPESSLETDGYFDEGEALYDVEEYNQIISEKFFSPVKLNGRPKTICINDKSVPVFYLLGGQKTCSSSVAASLAQAGVVWQGPKELQMFVQTEKGQFLNFHYLPRDRFLHGNHIQLQRHIARWTGRTYFRGPGLKAKQFPSCGSSEPGAVSDMTPTYMSARDITTVLRQFYAESANDLTFLIVMREPFNRLHSAFHYLRRPMEAGSYPGWHGHEYRQKSFCGFIKSSLAKDYKSQTGRFADGIQNSLYGEGLKRFLDANFTASQFVIVPALAYNSNLSEMLITVAEKLGMSLDVSREIKPFHANVGWQHPTLKEDLVNCSQTGFDEEVERMRQIFEKDFETLVKMLCEGHSKGMRLVGFSGQPGDCDAIGQYVKENW